MALENLRTWKKTKLSTELMVWNNYRFNNNNKTPKDILHSYAVFVLQDAQAPERQI